MATKLVATWLVGTSRSTRPASRSHGSRAAATGQRQPRDFDIAFIDQSALQSAASRRDRRMSHGTSDTEIGRRDFARMALGTLGAAALAGRAAGVPQTVAPGIKLCVQSPANPSDE